MFEKTKKAMAGGSGPLTTLDPIVDRYERLVKEKDEANVRTRAAIAEMTKERAALKKEHDELAGRIYGMSSDYEKILSSTQAVEAAAIAEKNVTEQDLKAGRVNVREFLEVGKRKETIDHEARAAAEEKMTAVAGAIRGLRLRQYEISEKIAELEEKIARARSSVGARFIHELDFLKKELTTAGAGDAGWTAHHFVQEANNTLGLAKGATIFHPAVWKVKSIREAELILLDPILQEKHFKAFREFLESIRAIDFEWMEISYTPCEFAGRPAGSISYFCRPKPKE